MPFRGERARKPPSAANRSEGISFEVEGKFRLVVTPAGIRHLCGRDVLTRHDAERLLLARLREKARDLTRETPASGAWDRLGFRRPGGEGIPVRIYDTPQDLLELMASR